MYELIIKKTFPISTRKSKIVTFKFKYEKLDDAKKALEALKISETLAELKITKTEIFI